MQVERPMMRVTSSPHIRFPVSTNMIMLNVVIALIPAGAFGVWHFGLNALYLILTAVVSAVVWEALIQKLLRRPVTVMDMSAVVTGLLVAYNMPASAPIWLAVVGSGIAIVLVKQIFGGLGRNFMNPALAARAIMLASWVGLMSGTAFNMPGMEAVSAATVGIDGVSGATPLMAGAGQYKMLDMFLGMIPGCIGEVSKVALIVGGVYLILTKVIDWRTPVAVLGTVVVAYVIRSGGDFTGVSSPIYQLLSGGLMLGAFFMATDYSTSPITKTGKIIFGVGVGLLTFVIREFNPSYPEGCSYAILIMNVVTPLIDKFVRPRIYGEAKRGAKKHA